MPGYDGISEYRKVALHRLHDAQELLRSGQQGNLARRASKIQFPAVKYGDPETRHLRGAMYLAGYAVECVLKAHLISINPPHRGLADFAPELTRSAGHGLQTLLARAGLEGSLGALQIDWNICMTWTPDWRYDPSIPSRGTAQNFVASAERIHRWVMNRTFTFEEGP